MTPALLCSEIIRPVLGEDIDRSVLTKQVLLWHNNIRTNMTEQEAESYDTGIAVNAQGQRREVCLDG